MSSKTFQAVAEGLDAPARRPASIREQACASQRESDAVPLPHARACGSRQHAREIDAHGV